MGTLERPPGDMCAEEIGLHAHNMLTIQGSTININGRPIRPLNERENFHIDNEQDIEEFQKI